MQYNGVLHPNEPGVIQIVPVKQAGKNILLAYASEQILSEQ
jgi:hypothetical protein